MPKNARVSNLNTVYNNPDCKNSSRNIYRYPPSSYWVLGGVGVGQFVVLVGFGALAIYKEYERHIGPSYIYVGLFCILFAVTVAYMCGRLLSLRPILVDDNGVSAFRGDRVHQFIDWKDVQQIERYRYPYSFSAAKPELFGLHPSQYHVVGKHGSIRIYDDIQELESLLNDMTIYARRHNIPAVAIDGLHSTGLQPRDL